MIGLAALGSTPAFAEPPGQTTTTAFEFDDTQVHGALPSPSLEILHVRRGWNRESLIRVREQFIPELYKSVEAL